MKRLDIERDPGDRRKLKSVCAVCGKDAWMDISNRARQERAYCSKECRDAWKAAHATERVELTCEICGKPFIIPKAWQRKGNRRFCSNACYTIYQRECPHTQRGKEAKPCLDLVCKGCGKTFCVQQRRLRDYCSLECRKAHERHEKICPICGKTFTTSPSVRNQIYCSNACKHMRTIYVTCKRCDKIFRQKRSDNTYCSEECRRPTITQTCRQCGKTFRIRPTEQGDRFFCSPRCYRCFTGETEPEKNARMCLETLGIPYSQEHLINGWRYPVDFLLTSLNTVLEIDGVYWHNRPDVVRRDARKTLFLQSRGYTVIRLPDTPFYGNLTEGMIGYIRSALTIADSVIAQTDMPSLYPIQLALPLDQERVIDGSGD